MRPSEVSKVIGRANRIASLSPDNDGWLAQMARYLHPLGDVGNTLHGRTGRTTTATSYGWKAGKQESGKAGKLATYLPLRLLR